MTRDDRIQQAHRKLARLRRRAHRIRIGVATVAVTVFLAAWLTIFAALAAGHDPVLTQTAKTTTTTSATTTATAKKAAAASSTSGTSSSGSGNSSSSSSSSSSATPVTTSQS